MTPEELEFQKKEKAKAKAASSRRSEYDAKVAANAERARVYNAKANEIITRTGSHKEALAQAGDDPMLRSVLRRKAGEFRIISPRTANTAVDMVNLAGSIAGVKPGDPGYLDRPYNREQVQSSIAGTTANTESPPEEDPRIGPPAPTLTRRKPGEQMGPPASAQNPNRQLLRMGVSAEDQRRTPIAGDTAESRNVIRRGLPGNTPINYGGQTIYGSESTPGQGMDTFVGVGRNPGSGGPAATEDRFGNRLRGVNDFTPTPGYEDVVQNGVQGSTQRAMSTGVNARPSVTPGYESAMREFNARGLRRMQGGAGTGALSMKQIGAINARAQRVFNDVRAQTNNSKAAERAANVILGQSDDMLRADQNNVLRRGQDIRAQSDADRLAADQSYRAASLAQGRTEMGLELEKEMRERGDKQIEEIATVMNPETNEPYVDPEGLAIAADLLNIDPRNPTMLTENRTALRGLVQFRQNLKGKLGSLPDKTMLRRILDEGAGARNLEWGDAFKEGDIGLLDVIMSNIGIGPNALRLGTEKAFTYDPNNFVEGKIDEFRDRDRDRDYD